MDHVDLDWRPDVVSPMPMFRQIASHVRRQIRSGALLPGTRLPPQRVLAQRLGVNRSTVVAAYHELQADGLLEGQSGGGTVVRPADDAESGSAVDWNDLLDRSAFVHDRSLAAEVVQARDKPGVISLAQGELPPTMRPTAAIGDLFHRAPLHADWLGYEGSDGYHPWREAVAAHMTTRGAATTPENVLTLSGAQQGLYLICRGLLRAGDTVVVEAPSYLLTLGVLQMAGIRVLRAPLDHHGIIPERLEDLLARHRVAMIFTVPAYQNPTGASLAAGRRAALLDLCQRYRVPLVEDDVYGELGFGGTSAVPLYADALHHSVIHVSSISKSVAPGLRAGWLIAHPQVIKRLAEMKYQLHYGSNIVSQWVAQEWLSSGMHSTHIHEVRTQLRERSTLLTDELRRQFGPLLSWSQPQGGFHLWARVNAPISSTGLFRRALEAGIGIKPGSLYGVPARRCWIRLSFQHTSLDELRAAPAILRRVVDEMLADLDAGREPEISDGLRSPEAAQARV